MASFQIAINWQPTEPPRGGQTWPSRGRLREAIMAAAAWGYCATGEIGLAVVDDPAIHRVNRQHLQHDYPTDVISFPYQLTPPLVEGELIVSWQTAAREAERVGWPAAHELLLYLVHGTLHLVGMDDQDAPGRAAMREAEAAVLQGLGIADAERFGAARPETTADQPRGE